MLLFCPVRLKLIEKKGTDLFLCIIFFLFPSVCSDTFIGHRFVQINVITWRFVVVLPSPRCKIFLRLLIHACLSIVMKHFLGVSIFIGAEQSQAQSLHVDSMSNYLISFGQYK